MYPALDHIIAFVYITQKHTVLYSAYSIYGISVIIFFPQFLINWHLESLQILLPQLHCDESPCLLFLLTSFWSVLSCPLGMSSIPLGSVCGPDSQLPCLQQTWFVFTPRHYRKMSLHLVTCRSSDEANLAVWVAWIISTVPARGLSSVLRASRCLILTLLCLHVLQLRQWPDSYTKKFEHRIYPITFSVGNPQEWKKLFKPCAAQRLFLPVGTLLSRCCVGETPPWKS